MKRSNHMYDVETKTGIRCSTPDPSIVRKISSFSNELLHRNNDAFEETFTVQFTVDPNVPGRFTMKFTL